MGKNMKISGLALTLLLAGSSAVSAQNWRNAPQYHLGVRAGLSVTNYLEDSWDGDYGTKDLVGPVVGVAFDTKVAKLPFYVETGMYYMNRGVKYEGEEYPHQASYTYTQDNHSLLVPALISYHAYINKDMSFQPFFGPYFAYGFDDEESDAGLRFGCGFNAKQLYVNMGFDVGLKDDFEHHEGNVSSFFLTVGWNFLGNR